MVGIDRPSVGGATAGGSAAMVGRTPVGGDQGGRVPLGNDPVNGDQGGKATIDSIQANVVLVDRAPAKLYPFTPPPDLHLVRKAPVGGDLDGGALAGGDHAGWVLAGADSDGGALVDAVPVRGDLAARDSARSPRNRLGPSFFVKLVQKGCKSFGFTGCNNPISVDFDHFAPP